MLEKAHPYCETCHFLKKKSHFCIFREEGRFCISEERKSFLKKKVISEEESRFCVFKEREEKAISDEESHFCL